VLVPLLLSAFSVPSPLPPWLFKMCERDEFNLHELMPVWDEEM
jgi:hypothetical protein